RTDSQRLQGTSDRNSARERALGASLRSSGEDQAFKCELESTIRARRSFRARKRLENLPNGEQPFSHALPRQNSARVAGVVDGRWNTLNADCMPLEIGERSTVDDQYSRRRLRELLQHSFG